MHSQSSCYALVFKKEVPSHFRLDNLAVLYMFQTFPSNTWSNICSLLIKLQVSKPVAITNFLGQRGTGLKKVWHLTSRLQIGNTTKLQLKTDRFHKELTHS